MELIWSPSVTILINHCGFTVLLVENEGSCLHDNQGGACELEQKPAPSSSSRLTAAAPRPVDFVLVSTDSLNTLISAQSR